METKTVMAVFSSERVAEEAVSDLRRAGFDREISVLAKDGRARGQGMRTEAGAEGGISEGVTTGGVLGGLVGLAAGAGALAIPGLGPLVAAGPIAGLLSGATTGGIAGGLLDWGIPEAEGRRYEEEVKRGNILVSVRSNQQKADEASAILKNHGAQQVKIH